MKCRFNTQEWGLDLWNRRWGFVSVVQQREEKQGGTQWLGSHYQSQLFSFFVTRSTWWNFAQIWIGINNHHVHYFQTVIVHTHPPPCLFFSHNVFPLFGGKMSLFVFINKNVTVSRVWSCCYCPSIPFGAGGGPAETQCSWPTNGMEKNKCLPLLFWKPSRMRWHHRWCLPSSPY